MDALKDENDIAFEILPLIANLNFSAEVNQFITLYVMAINNALHDQGQRCLCETEVRRHLKEYDNRVDD